MRAFRERAAGLTGPQESAGASRERSEAVDTALDDDIGDDLLRLVFTACHPVPSPGRILAGLMPDEREVHGLAASMGIQASRLHCRVGPNGEPVLLMDHDCAKWGALLIRRGLAAYHLLPSVRADLLVARASGATRAPLP